MENFITRVEHEEFSRRIDDENRRQNHRINEMEKTIKHLSDLTVSVEKMAVSVENMARELVKQGDRLDAIETRPLKDLGSFKGGIIGAIASAIGCGIVGYIVLIIQKGVH